MLLIRLLAIFLILITNTWLLSPVRSDALSRYKRAMAQRADRELSRLTGEPCTVSGVWRSRRQPRSLSQSQHRPPAARPRTHTTRRELYSENSAPVLCEGGRRFDTGAHQGASVKSDKGGWDKSEDVTAGAVRTYDTVTGQVYEKGSGRNPSYVTQQPLRKDAAETEAQTSSSSRVTRSLDTTFPYEEERNSTWQKVFPDSSTDSRGLQVLYRLQQEDGDPQTSTGTPMDNTDDYSGEVEEADPPASLPPGSPSPWGSPVPRVPPSWMTALYFNGRREQLRVKPAAGVELPRAKFSLELWVKPEGGQSNPAVIAGG